MYFGFVEYARLNIDQPQSGHLEFRVVPLMVILSLLISDLNKPSTQVCFLFTLVGKVLTSWDVNYPSQKIRFSMSGVCQRIFRYDWQFGLIGLYPWRLSPLHSSSMNHLLLRVGFSKKATYRCSTKQSSLCGCWLRRPIHILPLCKSQSELKNLFQN